MEEPGLISLRSFQSGEAIKDVNELQDLKPGEVEDDDTLQMTKMWIRKLKFAIKQSMIESDSSEDDDSVYEPETDL
jgi:hypothetical protein